MRSWNFGGKNHQIKLTYQQLQHENILHSVHRVLLKCLGPVLALIFEFPKKNSSKFQMMNLTFEHKQQNLLWRFFLAVPPCLRCFWLAFCKIWQKTRLSFSHSLGWWLDFLQCVLLYQDFIAIAITQKEVLLWKMQKFTMKTLIPGTELKNQTKISWKCRNVNNCPRIGYTEKVKNCSKKPFWR